MAMSRITCVSRGVSGTSEFAGAARLDMAPAMRRSSPEREGDAPLAALVRASSNSFRVADLST